MTSTWPSPVPRPGLPVLGRRSARRRRAARRARHALAELVREGVEHRVGTPSAASPAAVKRDVHRVLGLARPTAGGRHVVGRSRQQRARPARGRRCAGTGTPRSGSRSRAGRCPGCRPGRRVRPTTAGAGGSAAARAASGANRSRKRGLQLRGVEALGVGGELDDPLAQLEALAHAATRRVRVGGREQAGVDLVVADVALERGRVRGARIAGAVPPPARRLRRPAGRRSRPDTGPARRRSVLVNTRWLDRSDRASAACRPGARARGRSAGARSAARRAARAGCRRPIGSASMHRRTASSCPARIGVNTVSAVRAAEAVAAPGHQRCACDSVRNRS